MKAKKSYGQHFLNKESIAQRIAASLEWREQYQHILEVGPGQGMLTKYLIEQYPDYHLRVVEADRDMVAYLQKNYPQLAPNIIFKDFLKVRLEEYLTENFAIIGNFPYNISSQILFKLLSYKAQVPELVGMFQKEVAERVVAAPNSKIYGVLSILIQDQYEGEYLFTVDAEHFDPPPKVQSAVIRLKRRETALSAACDYSLFKAVVKNSFSMRRKMLRNSMKQFLPKDVINEDPFFQQRPENLSILDFVALTQKITAYRANNNNKKENQ